MLLYFHKKKYTHGSGCPAVGGVMGESVDNCLNLDGVDNLIELPTGCAEQTMVKMSPAIHAMKYLDGTNQWVFLKAERRDEARSMIQAGEFHVSLTQHLLEGGQCSQIRGCFYNRLYPCSDLQEDGWVLWGLPDSAQQQLVCIIIIIINKNIVICIM